MTRDAMTYVVSPSKKFAAGAQDKSFKGYVAGAE
jgi:hypothetical protein